MAMNIEQLRARATQLDRRIKNLERRQTRRHIHDTRDLQIDRLRSRLRERLNQHTNVLGLLWLEWHLDLLLLVEGFRRWSIKVDRNYDRIADNA